MKTTNKMINDIKNNDDVSNLFYTQDSAIVYLAIAAICILAASLKLIGYAIALIGKVASIIGFVGSRVITMAKTYVPVFFAWAFLQLSKFGKNTIIPMALTVFNFVTGFGFVFLIYIVDIFYSVKEACINGWNFRKEIITDSVNEECHDLIPVTTAVEYSIVSVA